MRSESMGACPPDGRACSPGREENEREDEVGLKAKGCDGSALMLQCC